MLGLCRKYNNLADGAGFCFGDQIPSFGTDWARQAKEKIWKGESADRIKDTGTLMTTGEFFQFCGFKTHTDIDYNGKAGILADLGKPIPAKLHGQADLLYDGGVMEHIPNIYQAMCNAMLLVKTGGFYMCCIPINYTGYFEWECYYNLNPIIYSEFFGANGFELIQCDVYTYRDYKMNLVQLYRRFASPGMIKYFQKKNAEQNAKPGNKGWIQNILNTDDLRCVHLLNPFDEKAMKLIFQRGLPPQSHVVFIGRKTRDLTQESIRDCVPQNYPASLTQGKGAA